MHWKIGTWKNLVKRSILISSDQHLLQKQLDCLKKVPVEINNYPSKRVENTIQNELEKGNINITNKSQTNTTDNRDTKLQKFLPFSGKEGIQLLFKMKKQLNESTLWNLKTCITYRGTELWTQFPVKDRTKFEHRHKIVYFSCCPNVNCNETYEGETDRGIKEHIMDHNKEDKNSHLLKHARESQHTHVWRDDFKSPNGNCKSSIKKRWV